MIRESQEKVHTNVLAYSADGIAMGSNTLSTFKATADNATFPRGKSVEIPIPSDPCSEGEAELSERVCALSSETREFSTKITHQLVAAFPMEGTGHNIRNGSSSDPIQLYPTIGEDLERNHKDRPLLLSKVNDKWHVGKKAASGTFAFIVKPEDNQIYCGKHGHDHLTKGNNVCFAGEITFGIGEEHGKLLFWTDRSGHYKPSPMMSGQADLPQALFSSTHERHPWALKACLKLTKKDAEIAKKLGWPVADVTAMRKELDNNKKKKTEEWGPSEFISENCSTKDKAALEVAGQVAAQTTPQSPIEPENARSYLGSFWELIRKV